MARMSEVIKLPSNGRIYPIKELTLQNMTISEEKYIYGAASNDQAIDKILTSCIQEDIDVNDLIVPDKHFALVRLRVLTYGDDYPVQTRCRVCGKTFIKNVKLSELEINELPDDFKEPIRITLPVSKDVLELRIPRSKDINRYNEMADQKATKYNLDKDEVNYIFNAMLGIISVNGEKIGTVDGMTDEELYAYVSEFHAKDSSYIKHQFAKINVGYNTRIETNCPHCKAENRFRLPMTSDFFLSNFED